jgi:hypothetical protein
MSNAAAFDPASLFDGVGATLLGDVTAVAPIGIPVMIGLIGLGIVIRVLKKTVKG